MNDVKTVAKIILRDLLEENDANYDLFGATMKIWFDIAEHLTALGENIPGSWGYSPGLGEQETKDHLHSYNIECITEMGNLCERLYKICKHC